MSFFETSNYIEAGLWALISTIFVGFAIKRSGIVRRDCIIAAIAFAFFGLSDVVEASTGAWWRPWWLLVWKGMCLVVIATLLVRHVRRKGAPQETETHP